MDIDTRPFFHYGATVAVENLKTGRMHILEVRFSDRYSHEKLQNCRAKYGYSRKPLVLSRSRWLSKVETSGFTYQKNLPVDGL